MKNLGPVRACCRSEQARLRPARAHRRPARAREYTLDGGRTFVTAPSTTTGKTTLVNLPSLTVVGVRVNLNLREGPGEWSPVVTIVVH